MLSVLLVNWNSREELRQCLISLRQFPPEIQHEVIVVDNDSQDGSADMVVAEFPEIRLILPEKNTGYAAGNNLAFAAASGDWLLTLNPDTEVFEGTLQAAIESLYEHRGHGALGARLIGVDGHTQNSVRGFPTLLGILGDLTGLGRLCGGALDSYRLTHFDYTNKQDAPQPMGTFLLFRRVALDDVGSASHPFDESFPIFFNEVDLLKRLADRGWACLYDPSVVVRHLGGVSTKQVRKSMIWESHNSLIRYMKKHRVVPALLLPILAICVKIAALVRARGWSDGFRP